MLCNKDSLSKDPKTTYHKAAKRSTKILSSDVTGSLYYISRPAIGIPRSFPN